MAVLSIRACRAVAVSETRLIIFRGNHLFFVLALPKLCRLSRLFWKTGLWLSGSSSKKEDLVQQDMSSILVITGGLIVLLILGTGLMQRVKRKMSHWDELSTLFPATEAALSPLMYKRCTARVGRLSFSSRDWPGLSVGFSPQGIIIRVNSKKYADLLVPWRKIKSASQYSLGSRTAAKVEIDSTIPLYFYVSGEALSAFATWHSVEEKPLQQFLQKR